MITSLDLYLINAVIEFAANVNFVSCLCFFVFGMLWVGLMLAELKVESDDYSDAKKVLASISKCKRTTKKIVFISLLFAIPLAFVPDKKTSIEIYLIPKIINNESLQKIPDDIHQWLIEQIKKEAKDDKE